MFRSRLLVPLVPLTLLLLVLAACSAATPTPAANGGGDGGGDGDTVTITGSSFGDDITVAAGTTVTFQNDDGFAHTATNGTDGTPADDAAFDEEVAAGASVTVTFDEAGTFDVTCKIHPSMNMTVTVE
jgi:plastocyanin